MAEQLNKDGGSRSPRPVIDPEECKGCGRCLAACPQKVLRSRARLNRRGVNPAAYTGSGCTGCGICFYTCPEPYAIQIETPEKRPPAR